MSTTVSSATPTVRFGRRSTRGVILGFSAPRVAAAGVAVGIVVIALYTSGVIGLLVSTFVWCPLLASAFVRHDSQTVIEWLPTALHFRARALRSQTSYRALPGKPRQAGTMALPGDAARLRFVEDAETGACMIHDPTASTLAAVVHVAHPAYLLLSADTQKARVSGWGSVLASLADSGSSSTIQVLEATIPDPGDAVEGWWRDHGVHDGSWAANQYDAVLASAREGSTTHRTTITVALDMKAASKAVKAAGRGVKGAIDVLRGDMDSLEHSLRSADLRVLGWLDADQLASLVRAAYDPEGGDSTNLGTAGPVAVDEAWSHLHHDTGYSTTLWVTQWPRIEQRCDFLHPLIFTERAVRKTLSIVVRPQSIDRALRQIAKEKTDAITDSAQKERIGQVSALADTQAYRDIEDREQALTLGHSDCEFSGFVTVTCASLNELESAVAMIQRAAKRANCDTRVMHGVQGQAFVVSALPFARRVS